MTVYKLYNGLEGREPYMTLPVTMIPQNFYLARSGEGPMSLQQNAEQHGDAWQCKCHASKKSIKAILVTRIMPTSQVGFKSSGQGSISEQPVQKKTSLSQNQTISPCLFLTSTNFRTMHVYFVFFHYVFNTQIVKSSCKIIKKLKNRKFMKINYRCYILASHFPSMNHSVRFGRMYIPKC